MDSTLDTVIEISLDEDYSTLVDREDYEWLTQWHWRPLVSTTASVYAVCKLNEQRLLVGMHRLIMEVMLGRLLGRNEHVDHINNNRLDNRRTNLRVSAPAENSRNRDKSKSNTSGYKGVSDRYKDGSWIAIITVNRKNIFLGRFATVIEAAQAYDRAALWYHGTFARLNFPDFDYGVPEEPKPIRLKRNPVNHQY